MIPISKPSLTVIEKTYVMDALDSTWIGSSGKYLDHFEQEFAKACEVKYAYGVCNGTVALHLALLALDVRPGDEVIVPSLTYVATANAVKYVGGIPVFVDVDHTLCMDPEEVEKAITPRTKGIIPVHLYGHPADMDKINHIAAIHGLWVVEDAAEAPFATYKDHPVGSFGKIATFSFFGNKILTSGEGGAVVTNDPQLALRLKTLKGQGMDPDRRYYFPVTGYNFRMTNIAAAILCGQLERREEINDERITVYMRYMSGLYPLGEIGPRGAIGIPGRSPDVTLAPWLFSVIVQGGYGHTRDELMNYLADNGVETRPFFIPLHTLPPFKEYPRGPMMNTNYAGEAGLNLPTYPGLTEEEISHICQLIRGFRCESY